MLKNILSTSLLLILFNGCASTYSSIKKTETPNKFKVTKIQEVPFGLQSSLLECQLTESKMICYDAH
jgi:hypothetical protein